MAGTLFSLVIIPVRFRGSAAVKEGKEIKIIGEDKEKNEWMLKNTLIQRRISPKLRAYLGKGIL